MIRTMMISLATAAAVAFIPTSGLLGADLGTKPSTHVFLKKVAEIVSRGNDTGPTRR